MTGLVSDDRAVGTEAAARPIPRPRLAPAYHDMLLRLAGHAPDELLTRCRAWLAQGRHPDVGRALAHAALAWGIRSSEPDIGLLRGLLHEAGADSSVLALVTRTRPTGLLYGFAPTLALAEDCLSGQADPSDVWPGQGGPQAAVLHDEVCRAAIGSTASTAEARALWRAWRFPADGSPWPDPRRVYVLEASAEADLTAITDTVQQALCSAGEDAPQVECYSTGAGLPEYQRQARACGALLWARTPDPKMHVAEPFPDEETQEGDRPVLDETEREKLSAYLWAGALVLEADESMADPLADPQSSNGFESVPLSVRTDGVWVWSEAVAHCLDRHGISPEQGLVDRARSQGFTVPSIDGAAAYRALAALRGLDCPGAPA